MYGLLPWTIDPTEKTLSQSEDRRPAVAGPDRVGAVGRLCRRTPGPFGAGGLFDVAADGAGAAVAVAPAIRLSTLAVLCFQFRQPSLQFSGPVERGSTRRWPSCSRVLAAFSAVGQRPGSNAVASETRLVAAH